MSDDGGAAYPTAPLNPAQVPPGQWSHSECSGHLGMSLHDFYVGQLLANPNIVDISETSDHIANLADTIAAACIEAKRGREEQEATTDA